MIMSPQRPQQQHRYYDSSSYTVIQKTVIERFIILQLNLAKICTGKQLNENSSEYEILEHILYTFINTTEEDDRNFDIISFVGLCTALYELPQSIIQQNKPSVSNNNNNNKTHTVQLKKSTLIFVPLEEQSTTYEILAIVQISRNGNATPTAVRDAIIRMHQFYCILRGGGIHQRLLWKDNNNNNNNENDKKNNNKTTTDNNNNNKDQCIYPKMDELYNLRKRMYKSKSSNNRSQERQQIQNDLDHLIPILPITIIRNELKIHYDALLLEEIDIYRNIIQCIPTPIALTTGEHLIQCNLVRITDDGKYIIYQIIKELMIKHDNDVNENNIILDVAAFVNGKLISHCTDPSNDDKKDIVYIPNETITLLMSYMSHFRFQLLEIIHEQSKNNAKSHNIRWSSPNNDNNNNKKKSSFLPFTLAFTVPEINNSTTSTPTPPTPPDGFLPPPPLSYLSALDELNALDGPHGERIWAPPIWLPTTTNHNNTSSSSSSKPSIIKARMCLYTVGDLALLLFLRRPDNESLDKSSFYQKSFQMIGEILKRVLDNNNTDQKQSSLSTIQQQQQQKRHVSIQSWGVPGQHIIAVNRKNNSLLLFPGDHVDDKKEESKKQQQKKKQIGGESTCFLQNHSWDCRYRLVSQLPKDSLLALEEAMDVVRARNNDNNSNPSSSAAFEMCTLLHNRWVYTYTKDEHELYVLYDAAYFVTVADVQYAAENIRKQLLRSL